MSTSQNNPDSFKSKATLKAGSKDYTIFRLDSLKASGVELTRLPFSLRILLENLLRHEDGRTRDRGRHQVPRQLGPEGGAFARDRVHAGARADAGLHRRSCDR